MISAYSGPPVICSTDQFWRMMCHIAFVRIDLRRGAIGNRMYYCGTPPELVEGFVEAKIGRMMQLLHSESIATKIKRLLKL